MFESVQLNFNFNYIQQPAIQLVLLMQPCLTWWLGKVDNWGGEYNPANATNDILVDYTVSLTVTPDDTGRQLETQLFFAPPPDGAIPPSDEKNNWATNEPTYKTSPKFGEL